MPERTGGGDSRDAAGLCATCTHARRITNDRGSVFVLCGYARIDPSFPKYPVLPVRTCPAYVQE
jgi:hypothetical protein